MTKGNIGKRREAVAGGRAAGEHAAEGCCNANQKPRSHDTARITWAKRMARVSEEFPLECPNCGGDSRLIAFITEPGPIRKILTHLGEPPPDGRNAQLRCSRAVRQPQDRRGSAIDRAILPSTGAPERPGDVEPRRRCKPVRTRQPGMPCGLPCHARVHSPCRSDFRPRSPPLICLPSQSPLTRFSSSDHKGHASSGIVRSSCRRFTEDL